MTEGTTAVAPAVCPATPRDSMARRDGCEDVFLLDARTEVDLDEWRIESETVDDVVVLFRARASATPRRRPRTTPIRRPSGNC